MLSKINHYLIGLLILAVAIRVVGWLVAPAITLLLVVVIALLVISGVVHRGRR